MHMDPTMQSKILHKCQKAHQKQRCGVLRVLSGRSSSIHNGRSEGTRVAGLERRLASAEAAAEASRVQLIEALEHAEAAHMDVQKYHELQASCEVR